MSFGSSHDAERAGASGHGSGRSGEPVDHACAVKAAITSGSARGMTIRAPVCRSTPSGSRGSAGSATSVVTSSAFVMKREGVDFPKRCGCWPIGRAFALTQRSAKQPNRAVPNDKQTLYRAMAWAEQQFHRCLLDAPEAAASPRISARAWDRATTASSSFTWASRPTAGSGCSIAPERRRSPRVLEAPAWSAARRTDVAVYDRFRGRLIFSIRDTEHRPIAFGARILPADRPGRQSTRPNMSIRPKRGCFPRATISTRWTRS